jgi:tetratricopeptide (TPR) repeat protein
MAARWWWAVFIWPIVVSAGMLQRWFGGPEEQKSGVWEERLNYRNFLLGCFALAAVVVVAAFSVIRWATFDALETKYAEQAAAALGQRNFARAVLCYQRLTDLRPDDRRYRYFSALACEGSGELDRAAALMHSLAPAGEREYAPAQLWIARRALAAATPLDGAKLRETESRLILLRTAADVGLEATVLLVRLYFLTGRAEFVLNDPALKAAALSVPELHLRLLQASVGRMPANPLRNEAEQLTTKFRERLALAADDLTARRSLAQVQILLGEFVAAAVTLQEGLTLHPEDPEIKTLLVAVAITRARAAHNGAAPAAVQRRLGAEAVRVLERYAPLSDATTLQRAHMQRLAGNPAEAERCYRLVVDKSPTARFELASLLYAADRRDEATNEFARVLADYESATPAMRNLPEYRLTAATAARLLGRWKAAEALLAPIAARHPEAKRALVQTHLDAADAAPPDDPQGRFEALGNALRLEPFYLPTIERLLQLLDEPTTKVAARQVLLDLAARGDVPASVYMLLGTDALTRGDSASAEKYLEHAVRMVPESPLALNNFAWSLAFGPKRELQRALKLVEVAAAKAPQEIRIRDTRGRILAELGRWAEAVVDLEACVSASENDADFHRTIARVYEKLALGELADRHRRQAEKLAAESQNFSLPD